MRKFILFFVLLITLVSCEKEPEIDATLTFTPTISYNNNVSKFDAGFVEFINGKIHAVNVYLTNADTVFVCKSNESVTIPFGLYEICSDYIPSDVKSHLPFSNNTDDVIFSNPFSYFTWSPFQDPKTGAPALPADIPGINTNEIAAKIRAFLV